jgi:hypothetical protein
MSDFHKGKRLPNNVGSIPAGAFGNFVQHIAEFLGDLQVQANFLLAHGEVSLGKIVNSAH